MGKSTVAAEASRILAAFGVRHAVIEGDNLDQAYPEPWREGIALAEHNLTSMWAAYRALGYHRLLFTNTVSIAQVDALSAALVAAHDDVASSEVSGEVDGEVDGEARDEMGDTVRDAVQAYTVLLTSTDTAAAERLARREWGRSIDEHIARSRRAAAELDAHAADVRIATDGRAPDDIAREILHGAGWLSGPA